MTIVEPYRVEFNPQVGDEIVCPGCEELVEFTSMDGWRNDNGYTCRPASTTHGDHIVNIWNK